MSEERNELRTGESEVEREETAGMTETEPAEQMNEPGENAGMEPAQPEKEAEDSQKADESAAGEESAAIPERETAAWEESTEDEREDTSSPESDEAAETDAEGSEEGLKAPGEEPETAESEGATEEAEAVTAESEGATEEAEAVTEKAEAVTAEAEGATAEAEAVTAESKATTEEPEAADGTEQGMAGETAADTGVENTESAARKPLRKWMAHWKLILVIVLVAAAAIIGGIYAWHVNFYKEHFQKGTVINGTDCSGMTPAEVDEMLAAETAEYELTIVFRDDQKEVITGQDFDYHYVSNGEAEEIFEQQDPYQWFLPYFTSDHNIVEEVELETVFDQKMLRKKVKTLPETQKENMEAPTDAELSSDDSSFFIIPETYGNTLDPNVVAKAAVKAVKKEQKTVDVESLNVYEEPSVTQDDPELNEEMNSLNTLLSASVTYELPDGEQVLEAKELKTWLSVDENGNYYKDDEVWAEHISNYVYDLADQVDTLGGSRKFKSTDAGTITVEGGEYGWKIDTYSEIEQLTEDLASASEVTREPVYSSRELSTENSGLGQDYVEIDLSKQHLWVYIDGKVKIESDIVSGQMISSKYTPEGTYYIYYMQRGRTLRGEQQADGSYQYECYVDYWMPFNGGIGMHDATWNPSFGGTRYINNGSHGCINLPLDKAKEIFNTVWTGMPVICYYSEPYSLNG